MESLGTENKDLNKELTVKKKYISKLEAKLTTGGYVERFAKLEEKTNRLQACHLHTFCPRPLRYRLCETLMSTLHGAACTGRVVGRTPILPTTVV